MSPPTIIPIICPSERAGEGEGGSVGETVGRSVVLLVTVSMTVAVAVLVMNPLFCVETDECLTFVIYVAAAAIRAASSGDTGDMEKWTVGLVKRYSPKRA